MMIKFSKDFFINNEVLFLGVTNKYKRFCEGVFKLLSKKHYKVIPVKIGTADFEFKIYNNINELSEMPKTVYTILDTEDNRKILPKLAEKGIKRILFHSKRIIDRDILQKCEDMGMETAIACPLMVFGSLPHKIHGFFAGVK